MLVRKITKSKWFQNDILNGAEVSADAITNCLKTTKNTLSVWRVDNEETIEEAVLAIVANQQYLETIDVVLLDEEYFLKYQIKIENTEGNTIVEDLKNTHVDLIELDYNSLGKVAKHIIESINNDKSKRFTLAKLREIIQRAIENKRLKLSDLHEGIQKKL